MAITNAQQYQQLVRKPSGSGRPGYRGSDYGGNPGAGDPSGKGKGDRQGRDTDFQQRGMSVGDYDKAVRDGNVGQNFGGRPNFAKDIQNKIQTLSLKNLYDKKAGLKNFSGLGLFSALDIMNPALKEYTSTDEDDLMDTGYGLSGKNLTDMDRLADAIDKSQTVGIDRNDYLDAFYGDKNPQDPRNKETDRGGNQILPLITPYQQDIVAQEPEEELSELQQMLADRGPLARRFAADGGIMDVIGGAADGNLDEMGRQMYGLGKLVKKATRAVKKIAKSPIGKAALLYTGAAMAGSFGAGQGLFSKGMFSPGNIGRGLFGISAKGQALRGLPELAAKKGLFGKIGLTSGYGGLMPTALGAITAASVLPLLGLGTGDESEEEAQVILDQSGLDLADIKANPNQYLARRFAAEGGSMKEPVAKKTMPLLDMDGMEKDYRAEGGFVPIGRMEKADDVPARLSKNEFVFTADAVRNAGDGNVDKGAEVMYNMMKNLEAGGDVSEESQGLDGARKMFQTSQRLEEVL